MSDVITYLNGISTAAKTATTDLQALASAGTAANASTGGRSGGTSGGSGGGRSTGPAGSPNDRGSNNAGVIDALKQLGGRT